MREGKIRELREERRLNSKEEKRGVGFGRFKRSSESQTERKLDSGVNKGWIQN